MTVEEVAIAAIICACKEFGHPYIIRRLAKAAKTTPNRIYRLLNKASRFYDLPRGVVHTERYI